MSSETEPANTQNAGKATAPNPTIDPQRRQLLAGSAAAGLPRTWPAPGLIVDGPIAERDKALQIPGIGNAWTMPIRARTDMLSTDIRTPVRERHLGGGDGRRGGAGAPQEDDGNGDHGRSVADSVERGYGGRK